MQRHRATTATRAPARARRAAIAVSLSLLALSPAGAVAADPAAPAQAPPATVEPPRSPEEQAEAERRRDATLAMAPDQPASPDDVFVAVVDAERAAGDASLARIVAVGRAEEARAAALEAAVERVETDEVVRAAVRRRDRAKAVLADERDRLSDLTVRAYVTGSDVSGEDLRALVEGDTSDPAAGRTVIFEQVLERQEHVTDRARKAANGARTALAAARADLDAALAVEADRRRTAEDRTAAEAAAVRAHDAAVGRLAAAEARLRAGSVGGAVPLEVAIIGMPRLNAGDLADWFATSPYTPRVATPIEDYARWFIEEGAVEGIRGDIAFAQAVLETGGFSNADSVYANNFSGIGHCDLCASGWTFPSPQLGVRAQIQLLKSYATDESTYVHDLVDRRLRGPAGTYETWGSLTTVWATDPGYGPKVMYLYSAMVDHALQRRAAGLGFDEPPLGAPPAP